MNIPLKLYKEFVEENGLEEKLKKWVESRERSGIEKPKITLGKLVSKSELRDGQAYWTGDIDHGGPEAWLYDGSHLMCFGEFISPVYAEKLYEISMADYQKCVDRWIAKRYGKKYLDELKRNLDDLKSVEEK